MMEQIGYVLEDIIIWDRRREYNNLRPLGYPYVFVVNKVHEYILIFKKPNGTTLLKPAIQYFNNPHGIIPACVISLTVISYPA